jgi:hypothetical protein
MNVFDTPLVELPPGPTAATRDSYTMPGDGIDDKLERLNVMRLFEGVGLPIGVTWKGCAAPCR